MALSIGIPAPQFSLPDQTGKIHNLSDYKGKVVLIYFYPKDDTPGCTTEACTIRDSWAEFTKQGIIVFGISTDSVKSHAKFAAKFELPFILLSDEEKQVVNQYGVWGLKKFMGRQYQGTKRESFLIDKEGKIAAHYDSVKPSEHAAQILADVQKLP